MKKLVLFLIVIFILTGCTGKPKETTEEQETRQETEIATPVQEEEGTIALTDFGLKVFREIESGENTLISPLSIATALTMLENGAEKETLQQMETMFGMNLEGQNAFLQNLYKNLPSGEKYKFHPANSIWIRDVGGLEIKEDFVKKNENLFGAGVYHAPFDRSTVQEINDWVKKNTDGQIEKLLEDVPPEEAVMYLLNALSFDGEWQKIYEDTQVSPGTFTSEDGKVVKTDFMNSSEMSYVTLPKGQGVMKPYAGDKYAFVALLPEEGLSLEDFLQNLTGEELIKALENASSEEVITSLPKFNFSYDILLNDTLNKMGMTDAFSEGMAEFQKMAVSTEGNIFVSKVLHKTTITVDEKGTKAGAVTSVEVSCGSVMAPSREVTFNRPFLFLIVDREKNFPIFMGKLSYPTSVTEESSSTDLYQAIEEAIRINHFTKGEEERYQAASFVPFKSEGILNSEKNDFEEVMVYGQALYLSSGVSGDGLLDVKSHYAPVIITFAKKDGCYSLLTYQEDPFINEQKYLYDETRACYMQIIEQSGLDVEVALKALLETICESPASSSNPGDYIKEHSVEYQELLNYGQMAIGMRHELQNDEGMKGLPLEILELACKEISEKSSLYLPVYEEAENGEYVMEGDMIFPYKKEVMGTSAKDGKVRQYIVLTTKEDITFEEVEEDADGRQDFATAVIWTIEEK